MRYSLFSTKNRQKTIFFSFLFLFCFSLFGLFRIFYTSTAQAEPTTGGQITEGAVGTLTESYNFNPLFATGVESDVASLLFLSLMRYNPETGEIEDYIATHDLSPDKRTYTFFLKKGILWHDGEEMTADDIYFTYHDVIQNKDFPGTLLKNTFADVEIKKVDDYTVSFTIPEKRKTFFTNFTLGILPEHVLIGTPVSDMIFSSFNQNPIGSGPYRFEEFFQEATRTSVRLSSFPDFFAGQPKIDSITLYVYPTVDQLIPHISEFDAIRPLQTRVTSILPNTSRFTKIKTITPRYVAVFFNLKDETLTTKKIRQAMRAAVDTDALAKKYYGERVDTPLVELWPQKNIVNISKQRAQQLLVESGYLFDYERTLPEESKEEAEQTAEEVSQDTQDEKLAEENTSPPESTSKNVELEKQNQPKEETVTEEEAPTVKQEIKEKTEKQQDSQESSTPKEENQQPAPEPEVGGQSSRYVYEPSREKQYSTTSTDFYIIGSFPSGTTHVSVNGYQLRLFSSENERFSYHASVKLKTLSYGKNTYTIRFYNAAGTLLDTESIEITLSQSLGMSFFPAAFADEISEQKKNIYRTNDKGEHISLSLSYLENFEYLGDLAKDLQKEWAAIGIEIILKPLSADALRSAMINREYEMLLLPQYLGYNLDPYPYFHLSQATKGGFNVSNWKNLKASLLLEEIRATHDPDERMDSLTQLRDIIIDDVPAIFLFTPYYSWLYDAKVKNVHVEHMVDAPDRYRRVDEFYIREARTYTGNTLSGFAHWLIEHMHKTFSL